VTSRDTPPLRQREADREPSSRRTAGAILAVSSRGTITKINLTARRLFGDDAPQEREQLGLFLARYMLARETAPRQLALSLPDADLAGHEVLLVPSDEEPAPADERPGATEEPIAPLGDAGASVNVADFVAHELRNSVAITLGLAQLLQSDGDSIDQAERASALRGIQTESEHALLVLDSLLKLVESRRREGSIVPSLPLHSVLHRVIADHKRRHPDRTLTVTGDAPVFVRGNSTWIQLALANLISNAEKVTPPQQPIQVNVRQDAEYVLVMVLDQGQALTEPMYQELWEIYSKGAPAGIEISGSGIGLALCKELVGAMDGHVWAGPRNGGGSAFAISLPSAPMSLTPEVTPA
jgi:signal transduction histidine kinase